MESSPPRVFAFWSETQRPRGSGPVSTARRSLLFLAPGARVARGASLSSWEPVRVRPLGETRSPAPARCQDPPPHPPWTGGGCVCSEALTGSPAGAGGSGGGESTEMNQTGQVVGRLTGVQVGTRVWGMQTCEALPGASLSGVPVPPHPHTPAPQRLGWTRACATCFRAEDRPPKPIAPPSPSHSPRASVTMPTTQRHVLKKLTSVQASPRSFPDTNSASAAPLHHPWSWECTPTKSRPGCLVFQPSSNWLATRTAVQLVSVP